MAYPKLTPAQRLAINYYKAKLNLLNVVSPRLAAHEAFDLFTRPYGKPRRMRPSAWMQKAETLKLESNGLNLTGYKWRVHDANEKKVLIIHGFAGKVSSFERYIGGLLQAGYDVYAYDAPGHGRSEGNRLNSVIYSQMIGDVVAAHGPFDGFIAHSLGGLALMLTLHRAPLDHEPTVALIAPATESTTAADKFFEFLQLPSTLRHAFDRFVEKLGGEPLHWYSISRVLPDIKAQILWLHDMQDTTTPITDVYPLMQKNLPHVHFHLTEGLGHSGIYKDNKVRRRIIDLFAGAMPPTEG
ncbi:MAG TPA: alpha/beta fold hydrolase [Phnomibacter sp.]|nr:alpha/beta fold hydrolase [Phnomibacter sp.]